METGPDDERRVPAAADATIAALLAAVRDVTADLRGARSLPHVGLGSRLDADLGLDSLSVAELLVRVEEVFDVRLPEEALVAVRTPRDLLDLLSAGGVPAVTADGDDHAPQRPPPRAATPGSGSAPSSLLDTLYGGYALAVFAIVSAVVWPLVAVLPTVRLRSRLVRAAGRLLLRLTGVRLVVHGIGNLPDEGPYVVVANHASHVDPLLLALILPEPAVFAAVADLADNPLVRIFLRRMDTYLVGRGDRARGVADAEALTEIVRAGRSVAFFPEGRRAPTFGLEPFRMGAFLVAARSSTPIVPITLRGSRTILPVGRGLPRRSRVDLTVSSPVTAQEPGWAGAVELHHAARSAILAHLDEPDLA